VTLEAADIRASRVFTEGHGGAAPATLAEEP
jgi:hypothetical protein